MHLKRSKIDFYSLAIAILHLGIAIIFAIVILGVAAYLNSGPGNARNKDIQGLIIAAFAFNIPALIFRFINRDSKAYKQYWMIGYIIFILMAATAILLTIYS